ncbi:MAG TPA: hypothetical protein VFY91_02685 [Microbacterium sp.]|nr:hypothetical protein [Microbacterium sp.]
MSTLTISRSSSDSVRAACATRLERVLLTTAAALTSLTEARIERRAARRPVQPPTLDGSRPDHAAAVHLGLLPR